LARVSILETVAVFWRPLPFPLRQDSLHLVQECLVPEVSLVLLIPGSPRLLLPRRRLAEPTAWRTIELLLSDLGCLSLQVAKICLITSVPGLIRSTVHEVWRGSQVQAPVRKAALSSLQRAGSLGPALAERRLAKVGSSHHFFITVGKRTKLSIAATAPPESASLRFPELRSKTTASGTCPIGVTWSRHGFERDPHH